MNMKIAEPIEQRNSDPSDDVTRDQETRISDRLNEMALDEVISLVKNEKNDFVRMCASNIIVEKLSTPEFKSERHNERLNILKELIETEANEWVYNNYIYFLGNIYRFSSSAVLDEEEQVLYERQLELLQGFSIYDKSELKRWLAINAILSVKNKYRPAWFNHFIKTRILKDPSNWVRSKIVHLVLSSNALNEYDIELVNFAFQWGVHTGYLKRPYPASISGIKSKKDSDFFSTDDELLSKVPRNTDNSSALEGDIRKKYVKELVDRKDKLVGNVILILATFPAAVIIYRVNVSLNPAHDDVKTLIVRIAISLFIYMAVAAAIAKAVLLIAKLFGITVDLTPIYDKYDDERLKIEYNEMKERERFKKLSSRIIATVVVIGVIGFFLLVVTNMGNSIILALASEKDNAIKEILLKAITKADCVVISAKAHVDTYFISGNPDYGVTVSARIKNIGDQGDVFVTSNISSSDGNYERKRTIAMKAGEVRKIAFHFEELTVNAKGIKYNLSCLPSTKDD